MMGRLVGVLPILLAVCLPAFAANTREYSHRIWRIEDGLPQNKIQAITQTPDGYLWIGTSEGLARFDGVRFTVFDRSNTPALQDDSILVLTPARDGSLWIGTEGGGLLHYQASSFRLFGVKEGLTNGFIRAIYEDSDGVLWAGADRGLFRMRGRRFERLDGTPEIPLASVVSILADRNRKLWIASSAGLLSAEGGKLARVRCEGDAQVSPIRALYESRGGTLYTVNRSGAGQLKGGCSVRDPALPDLALTLLHEDRAGNLWIGSIGAGLMRYRAGALTTFEAPSILPDNNVSAIFEDQEDNLWIGGQDGLLRLTKTAVTTLSDKDGLAGDNVSTVYEDRSGTLWIATFAGQVYRVNNGIPVRFHLPASAGAPRIRTVFEDSSGALWFGTIGGGVVRLRDGKAVTYTKKEGLRSDTVRQVHEDRTGAIWIATDSGLSRWDGHGFQNYYLEDGLSYPSVRCVASLRNGDVLAGTDAGLTLIHNRQIVRDPVFAELAGDKIWAIYEDADGGLWLGTRGAGLARVKHGKIARFTVHDGLPSNSIYQIIEDSTAKFWMSSPTGVFSAAREEFDAVAEGTTGPVHVVAYGISDGMETSQMNGGFQSAACKTRSGEIWFPSVKGAVRFNPAQVPVRRPMPVLIEKVLAGDRPVPLSGEVVIPPGHGKLEIDFTACNLGAPQRESFRYKLEGFDETWTSASRYRAAYYTNLPPGRYRFRVLASDAGSPLNPPEASLAFVWLPAFYQTAWFYALCAAGLAAIVWAAAILHARQTRARYALLLAERTRLAREMHDTVIQGCIGVSTLLEAASRLQRSNLTEAGDLLDHARAQVRTTLEEARNAVWNLRHASEADSSISRLCELAQKLGRERNMRIETEITGERVPLDAMTDRTLLLVGREALRNAVSHAQPSRVAVRIDFKSSEIGLEVRDDGAGFDVAGNATGDHGHFGIIGMRERVEQMGGSFRLDSSPGGGTQVVASLPLVRRAAGDVESDIPR
jgi:ligand-binding sensor domain-containing protein/signal transduction histidine kinase